MASARGKGLSGEHARIPRRLARPDSLERRPEFQQQCLQQLQAARKAGLLTAGKARSRGPGPTHRLIRPFPRFERAARGRVGHNRTHGRRVGPGRLHDSGPLSDVTTRPDENRSLRWRAATSSGVKSKTTPPCFKGWPGARLERLQDTQEQGFAGLTTILNERSDHLEKLLDNVGEVVVQTHAAVLDLRGEIKGQKEQIRNLGQSVLQLLEYLPFAGRGLHASDSLSIRSGSRTATRQRASGPLPCPAAPSSSANCRPSSTRWASYRWWQANSTAPNRISSRPRGWRPRGRPRPRPTLMPTMPPWTDTTGTSPCRNCGRRSTAIPARYTPFPLDKYEPTRILGGGGFGVAFLCQHRYMDSRVVVKALHVEELDRDVGKVFQEAQLLRQLDHPAIIRLWDCGYADEAAHARPYLVMDYFDGQTLEECSTARRPAPGVRTRC